VLKWWQRLRSPFDPERADENGLVAIGGSLEPELVLVAYRSGVFPWSSDPVISWWSPDPRAVFDLETFKAHRSTRQSARHGNWRFSVDEAFERVMRECAAPAPGRESTWISEDFVRTYKALHARGHAHSIEVWEKPLPSEEAANAAPGETEALIGGLYGVTLGGFFGGESMFNRRTDASKAAVMHLVDRLRAGGFVLCDGQVPTPHLHRLGAVDIPRKDYLERLARALAVDATLR
jgi:leucyl/phenylalanyl-tRNA---protein transferase